MSLERRIGQRLATLRRLKGLSQEEFGVAMGRYLGRAWSKQTVSAAEKGGRKFIARELVAMARVLDRPVGNFVESEPRLSDIDRVAWRLETMARQLRARRWSVEAREEGAA